jgi:hypothetical protein
VATTDEDSQVRRKIDLPAKSLAQVIPQHTCGKYPKTNVFEKRSFSTSTGQKHPSIADINAQSLCGRSDLTVARQIEKYKQALPSNVFNRISTETTNSLKQKMQKLFTISQK